MAVKVGDKVTGKDLRGGDVAGEVVAVNNNTLTIMQANGVREIIRKRDVGMNNAAEEAAKSPERVGKRIKVIRKTILGLSQAALAERLGINPTIISCLERGKGKQAASDERIDKIVEELAELSGRSVTWIKEGADEKEQPQKRPKEEPEQMAKLIKEADTQPSKQKAAVAVVEKPAAPQEEKVHHPAHYQSSEMEVIDVIEAFGLNFHLGNVVKYVLRAGKKGDQSEDLEKAKWYLERAIGKDVGQ